MEGQRDGRKRRHKECGGGAHKVGAEKRLDDSVI